MEQTVRVFLKLLLGVLPATLTKKSENKMKDGQLEQIKKLILTETEQVQEILLKEIVAASNQLESRALAVNTYNSFMQAVSRS